MRRFTSVFGMLLAMLWLPIAMMAESSNLFNSEQNPKQAAKAVNQALYQGAAQKQVLKGDVKLKAEKAATSSVKRLAKVKGTKAISSAADLAGEYVMTYNSLTTTGNDGGNAVTIQTVAGAADSIVINNFWESGAKVKAKFDAATKTISIPNQVLGSTSTDGNYDLAVVSKDGKPLRSEQIVGTVGEDGSISLSSWWAVFVMSGTNKDTFYAANYSTELVKANAKMTFKVWSSSSQKFLTASFGVYAEQPAKNVLTVKNFANYGRTITIDLNRDESASIASQIARKDATNGDWQTVAATFKEDYSGLTSYSGTINCNKATDKRTISWGNWTMLASKYYLGIMTEGKVETTFDITYPSLSVTEFEGEGTEANPYKIKSLDDMVLLSDKVNSNEEYNYGANTKYARVYLGKYFRMENDIDMSSYRFTPIGADWTHHFAGTFDGNGHTITGLTVNTGANGYAGLFGKCDTVSVIKNIKFDKAVIEAANYYAGVVAAWTLGDIYNCQVTNSIVSNTGNTGAAGITAIARKVVNCVVSTSNITGAFGYAAGVAGQVNELISNSYAYNVSIRAGGVTDTYPSGGVVASLYNGNAENCYFSGTLDGRYQSNLSLGGVAGVCYHGTISKCFATGTIYGYNNQAAVGGVVGNLYGTVTDSYSNTEIVSPSSRYAGGITGYVRNWKDNAGNEFESTVKNSYAAGSLQAETYQYDTATERRETLGTIMEGAKPTIENIYYDKQMVNFKSAEYGATTAELTSGSGVKGFAPNVWVFTEGFYPRLKGFENTEAAKFSASTIVMHESSSLDKLARDAKVNLLGATKVQYIVDGNIAAEGRYSSIVNGTLKLGENFGTDTLYFSNEGVGGRMLTIKVSPIPFDGDGSAENPYLLKTKDDLITLSKATTVIMQLFPDTYFKLTNDIDLEKDKSFFGICASIITGSSDAHVQFAGHIDGDGHAIHNMVIPNSMTWTTEPSEGNLGTPTTGSCIGYKGFVGRLAPEGSVKNLTIAADCDLTDMWATSAAVVGYNYGLVENCKNYADVAGYSCWIGGIVGQNLKNAVIRNCYNAGNISSGYMNAGGIAGTNNGLIENCENAGNVSVEVRSTFISGSKIEKLRSAGGITGGLTGGRIENCVNSGTISAQARVGGISATISEASAATYQFKNEVVNCINYGTVLAADKIEVGSIGGQAGTTGECADNYYDGQITIYRANGNGDLQGTKDVETSVLTSGKALENYSTDLWSFEAGKYPVLKQFASEALVETTRSIIANVTAGETVMDLHSDVELGTANGCKWTLADGKAFKIDGNKLVAPSAVKALTVDTLFATVGGIVKPIVVESRPVVPLAGKGTAESPYLISTPAEWNAMAEYMASCNEPMTGSYVQLADDITFDDKTSIIPFSYDGVTVFNGNFNGNEKTVTANRIADGDEQAIVFKATGENAYVHDLKVAGSLKTAYTKGAAVVGSLSGLFENVENYATVTGGSKSYVSGFAGIVNGDAVVVNCVNNGAVTAAASYTSGFTGYSKEGAKYYNCGNTAKVTYTGKGTTTKLTKSYLSGFIGYCYTDTIVGCYNTGEVVAENANTVSTVSGFIGMATANKDSKPYFIKDCYNTSSITSAANNAGLIVEVSSAGNSKFYMEGCYNTGDISSTATGTASSTYTAGISGMYTAGSTYRNCWNSGVVISQKPVYAAGLFCYYKGTFSAANPVKFIGCYNTGDIIASGNQGAGIVAYATNYSAIDSCYNVANVEGGFGLGGVVAALTGNYTTLSNSWNAGDITTTTNRAGGVIGYNAYGGTTISKCYNLGDVSSTGTKATDAYGVGGIAGQGGGHYTDVYSTGNVKGIARVGGLIGYPVKATVTGGNVVGTTIENAYFSGTVEAPADTCGMIIGVNMTANGKMWNDNNSVKNVYYIKECKVDGVNDAGTEISWADILELDLGDAWMHSDKYCLPVLKGISDNDAAKLESIAFLPGEGDSYELITKNFFVGVPEGVTITTDNANVVVNGNEIQFWKPFTGELVVTATAGESSNTTVFNCKVSVISGVGSIGDNGKVVVDEVFYNTAGAKVAKPQGGEKAVYVVVKTYNDGTTEVVKEVR